MRSPSLVLINDSHLFVSGDVVIHPTAAIASGVLLQADPGCQVLIGSWVCIGSGSILHANQGNLVIDSGAVLGSGVLVIGCCTIGENACVGSLTTILSCSVEPGQFVPAESLWGDRSRQLELSAESPAPSIATPTAPPPDRNGSAASPYPANPYKELESPWASQPQSVPQQASQPTTAPISSPAASSPAPIDRNGSQPESRPAPTSATVQQPAPAVQQVVYGRAYLEKMMIRMFPHRQALDSSPDSDSS